MFNSTTNVELWLYTLLLKLSSLPNLWALICQYLQKDFSRGRPSNSTFEWVNANESFLTFGPSPLLTPCSPHHFRCHKNPHPKANAHVNINATCPLSTLLSYIYNVQPNGHSISYEIKMLHMLIRLAKCIKSSTN